MNIECYDFGKVRKNHMVELIDIPLSQNKSDINTHR